MLELEIYTQRGRVYGFYNNVGVVDYPVVSCVGHKQLNF